MSKRFFEDVLVATRPGTKTRFSFPVSVAVHAAGITGLVVFSMATTGPLPTPRALPMPIPTIAVVRAANVDPPPVPRHDPRPQRPPGGSSVPASRPFVPPDPNDVPTLERLPEIDTTPPAIGPPATTGDGSDRPGPGPVGPPVGDGIDEGPVGTPTRAVMLVREPKRLRNVEPVYPELARRARVEGVVEIECLITPEGRISDVRVLSGHPLLVQAATQAVQQWVYTPTVVNGRALAAILTIRVTFHLVR